MINGDLRERRAEAVPGGVAMLPDGAKPVTVKALGKGLIPLGRGTVERALAA